MRYFSKNKLISGPFCQLLAGMLWLFWNLALQAQPAGQNGFQLGLIPVTNQLNANCLAVAGGTDLDENNFGEFVVFSDNNNGTTEMLRIYEATLDNTYAMRTETGEADITTGSYSRGLSIGNVDDDPEPEVLVAYGNSPSNSRIRIYDVISSPAWSLNEHAGSFSANPSNAPSRTAILGDSDGDGNPEFVVGNLGTSNNLEIYEWNGSGWAVISSATVADGVSNIVVADTDNDSKPEIVTVAKATGGLGIFKFESGAISSDGTVSNNFDVNGSWYFNQLVVDDLDEDGVPEIVVATETDNKLRIYEFTGSGYDTDEAGGILDVGSDCYALSSGDFDNDSQGEIYYSPFNTSGTGVRFIEYTGGGTEGIFTPLNFSAPKTIFDGLNADQSVTGIAYTSGGGRLLDGDLYRDIAVVTELDPGLTANPEVFVIESGTEDVSLPVMLGNFTADILENAIRLQWITESEIENEAFILERSDNGSIFVEIYTVPGAGNSSVRQAYRYEDRNITTGMSYSYRLFDRDFEGNRTLLKELLVTTPLEVEIADFKLYQNYPNPFNPSTNISFNLSEAVKTQRTVLEVFDANGKRIKKLYDGFLPGGVHSVTWDGKGEGGKILSSGPYFCRFTAGEFHSVIRMVLLK